MDYSNENFERFQSQIETSIGVDSLIWLIRDSIFAEAFYCKANKPNFIHATPGGDIISLARELMKKSTMAIPTDHAQIDTCVLLPSPRSNHVGRLLPFIADQSGKCSILTIGDAAMVEANRNAIACSASIGGSWKHKFRINHYIQARKHTALLAEIMPAQFTQKQVASIRMLFSRFFAWTEVWREYFSVSQPSTIICTFEKAPYAKSFFYVGREMGIAQRIHWIHGLRHASLQATLATELWCMTPGDLRFFDGKLPTDCIASIMDNPECLQLATEIGVIDPRNNIKGPLHFLFLGPGANESYNKSMRLEDLRVIKSIQTAYGDKIKWRFRPHPSKIDRFREELTEIGITVEVFSTQQLYEDLKWAHAVGSATSSLMLDWQKTGRELFWIQAEVRTLCGVDELIDDGIGTHLGKNSGVTELARIFPQLVS